MCGSIILAPICRSETEMVKKWLARDIFNQAGVQQAVDEGRAERRLTLLRRQYRMHPDISAISNRIIYGGRLTDELGGDEHQNIETILRKSPFGLSPLVLYDLSAINPWSRQLHPGRYNLYSATLTAELARQAVQAGIESVGVIAPYKAHARLIKKLLDECDDSRLRHLKISTAYQFQGLEQDVIIYDVAEGPPVQPWFANGVELSSEGARLINVAITRSKAQLVLVANVNYLNLTLPEDSTMRRVLAEFSQRGVVVDAKEKYDVFSCAEFERWERLLNPNQGAVAPNDQTPYTERNFFGAFFADLRQATQEIVIVSAFLTTNRARKFYELFRWKVGSGVQIRVFTKSMAEREADFRERANIVLTELRNIGVRVTEREGTHQKMAIIDRQIAWEGSLNILSRPERRSNIPQENMSRKDSQEYCGSLMELHRLD